MVVVPVAMVIMTVMAVFMVRVIMIVVAVRMAGVIMVVVVIAGVRMAGMIMVRMIMVMMLRLFCRLARCRSHFRLLSHISEICVIHDKIIITDCNVNPHFRHVISPEPPLF